MISSSVNSFLFCLVQPGSLAGNHLDISHHPHNGMATEAKIFFTDIGVTGYDSLDGLPSTFSQLIAQPYAASVRIYSSTKPVLMHIFARASLTSLNLLLFVCWISFLDHQSRGRYSAVASVCLHFLHAEHGQFHLSQS